ncbi:lanthionine synthetase LanC family protein [Chitinophaga sancti]|uniref:lanthionine synthetase LanC family protein n=1 Tax=Chitinophaga sancti TaxID=1004 RepID=UPI002A75DC91|nr:lanthionine synthetase LanC family protein [Chitinophaga sancti]WPQ63356.1 lanthionine synthetase LanC family protein [Chitinophaga sancti]
MSDQNPNVAPIINNSCKIDDYEVLLKEHNVAYNKDSLYLQVGEVAEMQGWIFYVPVSLKDFPELFIRLLPYLLSRNIAFKIPINRAIHNSIKEGNLGFEFYGKVICIYINDQSSVLDVAIDLISLTQGIKGTIMPGAKLGGIVYTRYGSFNVISTPNGEFLFNEKGELEIDEYAFPYIVPKWVTWPFELISSQFPAPDKKALKNKYYIIKCLRNTPKGRVMHAISKKNIFNFKQCLIKEGRPGIFTDEHDRDIVDRLLWQKELHIQLWGKIAIPNYIDFFQEDGNSYLVIDFIDGMRFENYIDSIFLFNSWIDLATDKKKLIINHLIDIVDNIDKLHQLGYVHRDISVTNFLVNKKGKIYLIDLELTYDLSKQTPNPPFQVGTPGYMSPEQKSGEWEPAFNQDIYSLGALMLSVISHFSPRKFSIHDKDILFRNVKFLTGSDLLTKLICGCLSEDFNRRPKISEIRSVLNEYLKSDLSQQIITPQLSKEEIQLLIQRSLDSFDTPLMVNEDGYWVSLVSKFTDVRNVFIGLGKGISGVIFLLAKARIAGFDVDKLLTAFERNWMFLKDRFLFAGTNVPPGLYNGSSGVAVAIAAAIESGLLEETEENKEYVENCLYNIPEGLNIVNGIAGYGFAIIYAAKYLKQDFVNERISLVLNQILNTQQRNGNWLLELDKGKKDFYPLGFEDGIAGILYFLLQCCEIIKDDSIKIKTGLAMRYLFQQSRKKFNKYPVDFRGRAGFAFIFLKGYSVLGDLSYLNFAKEIMLSIPKRAVLDDLSFFEGIVGIGFLGLESQRIIHDDKFLEAILWTINIFKHTSINSIDGNYWVQDHPYLPCGDLMEGNGGIIHYLISYLYFAK